jgi:Trk K+ transport system NAD-binding subunit
MATQRTPRTDAEPTVGRDRRDTEDGRQDGPLRLVVGGGAVGRALANGLGADGRVHHLDTDPAVVDADGTHTTSHAPDLAEPAALARTGVGAGDTAVVATGHDGRNLLVTQLRMRFELERVVVVLADPRNREAFDLPGVEVVCPGAAVASAVRDDTADRTAGTAGR